MKPMKPGLVSIITLNWHHYSDLTGPFIRYIDAWTPDPKELIVVDQGSAEADRLALINDAHHFPWLKVVLLPENVGFPAGTNVGNTEAEGEYICWMNNDMIINGDWLTPMLERLRGNHKTMVGAHLVSHGGWNEYVLSNGQPLNIPYLEGWLLLVYRSFLEEVGEFDEAFGVGSLEDVHLCWRAQQAGYQLIEVAPLPLTHLRGRTVMDGSGRINQIEVSERNFEMMKGRVRDSE